MLRGNLWLLWFSQSCMEFTRKPSQLPPRVSQRQLHLTPAVTLQSQPHSRLPPSPPIRHHHLPSTLFLLRPLSMRATYLFQTQIRSTLCPAQSPPRGSHDLTDEKLTWGGPASVPHSLPATPTSWRFPEHCSHIPALRPLNLLVPTPGTLPPHRSQGLLPQSGQGSAHVSHPQRGPPRPSI